MTGAGIGRGSYGDTPELGSFQGDLICRKTAGHFTPEVPALPAPPPLPPARKRALPPFQRLEPSRPHTGAV